MTRSRPFRYSSYFRVLPFLFLFFPVFVFAFNSHQPFDISADLIEYNDADQSLSAEGRVIVTQGTSTLKTDSLRYERANQKMFAKGHVFVSDQGSVMLGDMLEYNLTTEEGKVTSALGYHSPWIFTGEQWEKHMDYVVGRDIKFTSCELRDPHYFVRSRNVHLVPDQYFWAWNNVVYADKLPVFYSPFVYKSLAKRRVVFKFLPGTDDVNGNFLKTQTTIRITDDIYNKVLYDHYSETGNGFGNEFNYKHKDKLHGSLFGYYIDPRSNPDLIDELETEQYNLRSYHWQTLGNGFTLQSNVNLRKNISFNNRYFPQDTNQSVNDLSSSVALTQQKGHVNHRIVVEGIDSPDPGDNTPFAQTHIQTASLPRYDITFYQVPLWKSETSTTTFKPARFGPLLFNANATMGNTYYRLDKQNHPNANGAFTLSEAIVLSRQWSFTPTLTPQVRWQEKFDAQPPPPVGSTTSVSTVGLFKGYQGRIGTAETLRWRPLSSLTWDQTYSLTARMEPNGTALDRSPADGGIESHHLNWLVFWRPTRKIMLRSFAGYDMRNLADESLETYHQRKWDPWTTELTHQITRRSDYFLRYGLAYYPFRGEFWEGDYRFRGAYKTLWQTGILYSKGAPGFVTWNNSIGTYLSPGWRIDAVLHSQVPTTTFENGYRRGHMIDEEVIVTRDLHCWQAQFIYRNVPPITQSYSVLLTLKLGVRAEEEITNEDLETQFYPWRARTYAP